MLRTRRPLLALIAILALVVIGYVVQQVDSGSGSSASTHPVAASALPVQARDTITAIEAGGPFPYPEDGAVFDNREHLLPGKPTGYYHEYTVPTPGADNRGARRIVVGGKDREFYYTGDHYASFHRIQLNR